MAEQSRTIAERFDELEVALRTMAAITTRLASGEPLSPSERETILSELERIERLSEARMHG